MSGNFESGLKIRKEVLGEDYVKHSMENTSEFNMPIQVSVTKYCWGEIWGRKGLDKKQRSFLNLSMLTALNRPHELKFHVSGALNNGSTKEVIEEVVLQSVIYCGVRAAIVIFRTATG